MLKYNNLYFEINFFEIYSDMKVYNLFNLGSLILKIKF